MMEPRKKELDQKDIYGHCLCRAIEFEVTAAPLWVAHCHCDSCRRHTASTVATLIAFNRESFTFTKGEPGLYESSPGVRRLFCATCGTPMAYEADRRDNEIHVYLGTLEHPEDHVAQFHVCYKERLPWLHLAGDITKFPEFP